MMSARTQQHLQISWIAEHDLDHDLVHACTVFCLKDLDECECTFRKRRSSYVLPATIVSAKYMSNGLSSAQWLTLS